MRQDDFTEVEKVIRNSKEAMISISALLNKRGHGKIYLDPQNSETSSISTISDATLSSLAREISDTICPQISPIIDTITVSGAEVIRISFEGRSLPYSAFGRYYIRTGEDNRELSPRELRALVACSEYEKNWESISSYETIDDIDEETLNKFLLSATSCGRLTNSKLDRFELLTKLNLLSGKNLTNAGRYLFSARKPIVLKMAVFATDNKTTFLDIVREEGNIFQLIDRALNYIIRNIRWRVKLSDDGIRRLEIPEVPIDAIRESIVNSFAHARYDIRAVQHEIDILSNRISIANPGSFANPFEPKDFATKNLHSFLRNETIARTLYLCKDVETFGSGIRKIYSLCEKENVAVSYTNGEFDFTIEFSRVDANILPKDSNTKSSANSPLVEAEANILAWLKENPHLTVNDLVEKSGKSPRMVSRYIASLKSKALIRREGSNKTGCWKIL